VVFDIGESEINGGPLTLESLRYVVAFDIRELEVNSGPLSLESLKYVSGCF
jgi:hypothetical protein